VAGEVGRQAAKAVVTAEFDDDDFRVQGEDGGQAGDGVLGGGAAGALVDDFVVVAVRIDALLKEVGICLAGLQAIAGCNAVSKADQDGLFSSRQRGGEKQ